MAAKSGISGRLRWLVETRFGSQKAMAEAVGVSQEQVSRWVNTTTPQWRSLSRIAEAAGDDVSVVWLEKGEGSPPAGYQCAEEEPPATRQPPAEVPETEWPGFRQVTREELPERVPPKYIPIVGRIAAGAGEPTDEAEQFSPGEADAYVEYIGGPPHAFAVRVVGDSMDPPFRDGDLVIADGDQPVRSGLAAVIFDQDSHRVARLKTLYLEGDEAVLISNNDLHEPVRLPAYKVHGAYKIINHLRRAD